MVVHNFEECCWVEACLICLRLLAWYKLFGIWRGGFEGIVWVLVLFAPNIKNKVYKFTCLNERFGCVCCIYAFHVCMLHSNCGGLVWHVLFCVLEQFFVFKLWPIRPQK